VLFSFARCRQQQRHRRPAAHFPIQPSADKASGPGSAVAGMRAHFSRACVCLFIRVIAPAAPLTIRPQMKNAGGWLVDSARVVVVAPNDEPEPERENAAQIPAACLCLAMRSCVMHAKLPPTAGWGRGAAQRSPPLFALHSRKAEMQN
jgi:hypothetical protein